jgi:predicted nucleotidyltransferase
LAALRRHGVVRASLFGSVSRGEERPDSDVDLLVTFDRTASFGERLVLEEELGRLCGRPVEVVTNLHPAFAPYITPTLVPLPL